MKSGDRVNGSDSISNTATGSSSIELPDLSSCKILLVEDDHMVQKFT